jgi:hypothetical protein
VRQHQAADKHMSQPCTCPELINSMNSLCESCRSDYGTYTLWFQIFEEAGRLETYSHMLTRVYNAEKEAA